MTEPMYAIDFGTSNSLVALVTDQKSYEVINLEKTSEDKAILRSLIYFPEQGSPSFGKQAITAYVEASGSGRFLRSLKKFLPAESFRATQIQGKPYRLEELISSFLREIKRRADATTGASVDRLLLGRPAKYSDNEARDRLAEDRMAQAAALAGFTEVHFCPEPIAAAFDYRRQIDANKTILVVDLGGGTSDFTLIRLSPNIDEDLNVLSLGGVSVAGDKLDGELMAHKIGPHLGTEVLYRLPFSSNTLKMPTELKFRLMSPADITLMSQSDIRYFLEDIKKCTISCSDNEALENLFTVVDENLGFAIYERIEGCKKSLCLSQTESLFEFNGSDLNLREKVTYGEFVTASKRHIQAILQRMDEVVNAAGLTNNQVDSVFCTGGTSKVPEIRQGLIDRFGEHRLEGQEDFRSVVQGLALSAQKRFFNQ